MRSAPASRPTRASSEAQRAEQLKRLDGIATILAKTAARDTSLLALLAEDAVVSDAAAVAQARHAAGRRRRAGPRARRRRREPVAAVRRAERRVVPQSVVSRQLANPFLAPDFSAAAAARAPGRAGWPAGSCSARCSGRSSTPAAEPRRAWTCPSRPAAPGRRAAWS